MPALSRPACRRPRHPRALVLVLLAGLATGVTTGARAGGDAMVLFLRGPAQVMEAGHPTRPLRQGDFVHPGQLLRAGTGARLQLRLDGGALLALQADTDLRIGGSRGDARAWSLSLYRGGLRYAGPPGDPATVTVSTVVATAEAQARDFSVTLGDGLRATVGEGTLRLRNPAGELALPAHGRGLVRAAGDAPLPLPSDIDDPPH